MLEIAAQLGLEPKIAVVTGDDLIDHKADLLRTTNADVLSQHMKRPEPEDILCANAYLGAFPIACALAEGADFVITGRAVDSALVLGPLIKEFGWPPGDYDMLAAGSLAGHIIECGAQATGATFTDWLDVPDLAHIGYPIIEFSADGSFVVTKPEGTGGLVSRATVAEQLLYEVGDPQAYMLPDVVCDFSQVVIEEIRSNAVRVSNAIGRPPSDRYKVSVAYEDGHRFIGLIPVIGIAAAAKGQLVGSALIERSAELLAERGFGPFRNNLIEILGAEASYGSRACDLNGREVIVRIGVEHDNKAALKLFVREFQSPGTSMTAGITSLLGTRHAIEPVIRIYSCFIPRNDVAPMLHQAGVVHPVPDASPPSCFDPTRVERPRLGSFEPKALDESVRLIDLAWARSGDKGNSFNIGVIARRPEYLPYIRHALTTERLSEFFGDDFRGSQHSSVQRFDLPGLNAVNFLLLGALGGGQLSSLRLDALAKSKAQQLLDCTIAVPASIKRMANPEA